MVKIKKQLVATYVVGGKLYAKGSARNSWVGMAGTNEADEIAVHQTGNLDVGANAQMHANLQSRGNDRVAGWHYQVDETGVIQSFDENLRLYHSGDAHGHRHAIGIEMCVNKDGDYVQTLKNTAELIADIRKRRNMPISKVKQHNEYSGKQCPAQLRAGKAGITWTMFIKMCEDATGGVKPAVPSKPARKPSSSGGSIVDYLNAHGKDSSFSARKRLARENGISNYTGTASQNLELLNLLKSKPAQPQPAPIPSPSAKPVPKTNSIVDYLNAIGHPSDFNSRKTLARRNGIANYTGTAKQNVELLNKMKSHAPATKPLPANNSIVDYLSATGRSTSFASRKQLAERNGIRNYTGTASQNLQLLKKLRGY